MNREIKFKALMLCNDNKKRWVYGYLVDEEHIKRKEVCLSIDKKTICQYTGLKDKNGVEIYENDIVKVKNYHYYKEKEYTTEKIIFSDGMFVTDGTINI